MQSHPLSQRVARPFYNVKTSQTISPSPAEGEVIHHNVPERNAKMIIFPHSTLDSTSYGVSSSSRVLSPGLLLKKYYLIRDCLADVVGLSVAEREVVLRLIRFWAYYGRVYAKERTITESPGCSKATYWRTIRLLTELGMIRVVNRYLIRPHAQISNLYLLHNLIIVLARYLAEHGQSFKSSWIMSWLTMPGSVFWPLFRAGELTAFCQYGQPPQSSP